MIIENFISVGYIKIAMVNRWSTGSESNNS